MRNSRALAPGTSGGGSRVLVVGIYYAPDHTGIAPTPLDFLSISPSAECRSRSSRDTSLSAWHVDPRCRWRLRSIERRAGLEVRRLRHYVPRKQSALRRAAYELTFALQVAAQRPAGQPDVVVAVVPSLFSAMVAERIAARHGARLIVWVQDLMGHRWKAARSSTSSPPASARRSTGPGRRPAERDIRVGGGAGRDDPAISRRRVDRQAAFRDLAGPARRGRTSCSPGSICPRARLSGERARPVRGRDPCRADERLSRIAGRGGEAGFIQRAWLRAGKSEKGLAAVAAEAQPDRGGSPRAGFLLLDRPPLVGVSAAPQLLAFPYSARRRHPQSMPSGRYPPAMAQCAGAFLCLAGAKPARRSGAASRGLPDRRRLALEPAGADQPRRLRASPPVSRRDRRQRQRRRGRGPGRDRASDRRPPQPFRA